MPTHNHTPMLGNARKFYLGTATAGTPPTISYPWLAGEQSNNLNFAGNPIEVSDKSSAWQKFIQGIRGATADVTVYADDEDTQQKAVIDALYAGSTVLCFVGTLSSSTPSAGFAFEAVINSIGDTNDNGAVSTRAISLSVNGEPTRYPTRQ